MKNKGIIERIRHTMIFSGVSKKRTNKTKIDAINNKIIFFSFMFKEYLHYLKEFG